MNFSPTTYVNFQSSYFLSNRFFLLEKISNCDFRLLFARTWAYPSTPCSRTHARTSKWRTVRIYLRRSLAPSISTRTWSTARSSPRSASSPGSISSSPIRNGTIPSPSCNSAVSHSGPWSEGSQIYRCTRCVILFYTTTELFKSRVFLGLTLTLSSNSQVRLQVWTWLEEDLVSLDSDESPKYTNTYYCNEGILLYLSRTTPGAAFKFSL